MLTRANLSGARSTSLYGSIFVVSALILASSALAQESNTESATTPLLTIEERPAVIRKAADETKTLVEAKEEPSEALADKGFGPFISLNPGEELLAEIHFDSGSTQPTYIGKRKIEHVLKDLKALNPTELRIVGFTDRTGSKELNKAISEARAESVADLLQQHGLDIPVVIDPRGEETLLYPTPDGEAEPLNRCVGIIAAQ